MSKIKDQNRYKEKHKSNLSVFFLSLLEGSVDSFPLTWNKQMLPNIRSIALFCLFVWIYYDMILGNENALLVLWLLIPNKVAVKIKWNNIDEMPNTVLGM